MQAYLQQGLPRRCGLSQGRAPAVHLARPEAVIARLRDIVRDACAARGEDPDSAAVAANIEYNSTDCRRRAAALAAYVERAYGLSMRGLAVCELGAGFGGLCVHFALDHGAGAVLAVDQAPPHTQALETMVGEFGLAGFTVVEADLQEFPGHDATMDVVVLNDVLYTADLSPARVAAACARLLRAGGVVLFRNVNRAFGPAVVTHRQGTQFLDPDSADRAARFLGRGTGSTIAHRPLSPWGLAAFLRQAGFADFRLSGDTVHGGGGPQRSRGLGSHYMLAARRDGAAPRALHRIAPPPAGLLDLGPFRRAVDRRAAAIRTAAEILQGLFGGPLTAEIAHRELHGYLVDRLLMDELAMFRGAPRDRAACDFADAVSHALDRAFAAVMTRHAGWTPSDFANSDPDRLASVLDGCVTEVRRGFRQPAVDRVWAGADWDGTAAQAVAAVLPGNAADRRGRARAARLLRWLVADRARLGRIGLLARTADPLTGSIAEEYAEAAIDRIEGEIRDAAGQAGEGQHPVCREALMRLIEDIETARARCAGAADGA